jgi:hypothetical protein
MGNWNILSGRDIRLMDAERTIMDSLTPIHSLDDCVLAASNRVRGYVAGGAHTMEPAPAVPPECVDDVVALARESYLCQDPSGTLLTPVRQKQFDDAMAHLRDVAKRISAVTQGAVATPDIAVGKWGSAMRIAMRTEFAPPPTPPPFPVLAPAGALQILLIKKA